MTNWRKRMVCIAAAGGAVLLTGLSAAAADETVTLNVAIDPAHGTDYINFMKGRAKAYTAETGTPVNIIVPSDERTQINVWAAAGTLPDVMDVVSDQGLNYVREGVFLDLRSLIQKDAAMSLDHFNEQAAAGFTLPGYLPFAHGGMVYAIPFSLWNFNGAVNTDMLNTAGLADPMSLGDQWTWASYADYMRKLTRPDANGKIQQYGAEFNTWIYRFDAWFRDGHGAFFEHDFDPTKVTVDSPENRQTLATLVDWLKEGIMTPQGSMYGNGKAAFQWSAGPNEALVGNHPFKHAYVTFPRGPQGDYGTEFTMMGTGIASTSKHVDLAWKWLKWLWGSEKNAAAFSVATIRPPALRSLASYYVLNVNNKMPHSEIVIDSTGYPGTGLRPMVRNGNIVSAIETNIKNAFSLKVSPNVALAQAQQQAQGLLDASLKDSKG
ncbi:MAG TPA: extracellular solute-binding protein [Limnochordia bacterium]|nr:extracellular solute-binding protein [Limnochordia bacterium]